MKSRMMCYGAVLAIVRLTHLWAQPPAGQVTPVPKATYIPLQALTTPLPADKLTLLIQQNVTLTAKQSLRVFGRMQMTGSVGTTSGSIDYIDAYVRCLDSSGNLVQPFQDGMVGTNYVENTPAGPNYPAPGNLVLYPSTLFTASASGTYTCQLAADAGKPGMMVGHAYQGDDTTWLRISAPIGPGDAYVWYDPNTCPEGDPHDQCFYVPFSGNNPQQVFPAYVSPCGNIWCAPKSTAFVDVTARMQATLCGHTSSCGPGHRTDGPYVTVVDTYLELDQLTAAGVVCRQVLSPVHPSILTGMSHHVMIYDKLLTVPVYPSCGEAYLLVKYYIRWVSGPKVKIDNAQATAFASFHGSAQLVPNVVGLQESAAASALARAGYLAASPTAAAPSTAAIGTVIAQNPAGGSIIELPGSLVNLTLASAGVTVPNVVGKARTEAVDILNADGLAHELGSQPGCQDPNVVIGQNPLGGAVVAPGTTVTLDTPSSYTSNHTHCQAD